MPAPSAATCRLLPAALARPVLVLGSAARSRSCWRMLTVPLLGADLIPQLAQDRFEMTVKLPPGTPLRETDALVRDLQREHAKDDGVHALYGVSGSGTRLDASPTESGENIGKLTVVMADGGSEAVEAAMTERLRASDGGPSPVRRSTSAGRELFSFSTPLEIELRGQDLASHRTCRPEDGRHAARQPALRRRQVDGGAGLPRDPDPLRPGPRRVRSA